eukprot:TRINITY_DN3708_c0_g1_i2.p1 TRINITY_DN3708_c0_g1~~TRINITY_DN3708_c0_g1_i2.p1  ORF type:complete len:320 (-),score=106.05 TRINITY_DN3708_c0_g1_i2:249-1208(-)
MEEYHSDPGSDSCGEMEMPSVVSSFVELVKNDRHMPVAVAAVRALTEVLKSSSATTMMGVQQELHDASVQLQSYSSAISLQSGCKLFTRFVTRTAKESVSFEECKKQLIDRGEQFMQRTATSRQKISSLADPFISDGHTVLVHGFSRGVTSVLVHAAASEQKRFSVLVTESRPDNSGYDMVTELHKHGIPTTLIMDSAAAHLMQKIDFVLVGAEAVVENGGIINKIGTFQLAIAAKAFSRPLYVAAECYKFARVYPLDQFDLPEATRNGGPLSLPIPDGVKVVNPKCDYTPPAYITLLITDLGVLTPSAVSDELIKLYN